MREAYHVIDKQIERIPRDATPNTIVTYKKLTKKGIYQCPHCQANLIVKAGEKRGVHFSHFHSEACEKSKIIDAAERKYDKQIQRESKIHKTIVDIIYDELKTSSKINANVQVDWGFRAKMKLSMYPDIWLKIGKVEHAISVITNVNPEKDSSLTKRIKMRQEYFKEEGMKPIWFIENKELAIEKDKNAIVLWDVEATTSIRTDEDIEWEHCVKNVARDLSFFEPYNYQPSMQVLTIEVGSLYYISSNEHRINVSVFRFLKDRDKKPNRSFLLNGYYNISFSEALAIENETLRLSNSKIESQRRNEFVENHRLKLNKINDEKRREREEIERKRMEKEQRRKSEEEQKRLLRQKKLLRQKMLEQERKKDSANQNKKSMTYPELRKLLKQRINLSQKEQMELWTKHIPKIGLKNVHKVWELVEEHKVQSFDELRNLL